MLFCSRKVLFSQREIFNMPYYQETVKNGCWYDCTWLILEFFSSLPMFMRDYLESIPKGRRECHSQKHCLSPNFLLQISYRVTSSDSLSSLISKMSIMTVPTDDYSCGEKWAVNCGRHGNHPVNKTGIRQSKG